MYLMDKDRKAQEPEKVGKRKALQEELTVEKKRKKEPEITAQKLESADKKAKEAEKKTDVAIMKTLLIVKCFKKKISGDNEDRCSKTRSANKRIGKETKTSQLILDQPSITKM